LDRREELGYFTVNQKLSDEKFGGLLDFSYLCTRFPRNRWQEDRRVACYVAHGTIQQI
jgi:hypothetical protein